MTSPTTVAAIVARIEVVHADFAAALALLDDDRLQAPCLDGGRSGKDLLAHLTFWDRRLLHAIAPAGGPDVFRLAPPLIADIPYDEHWADVVNERIFDLNRERALPTVKAEFAQTCADLRQAVRELSEHAVFAPAGLSALLGEPFLPMVTGAYEHYEEHMADLERIAHARPSTA